MPKFDVSKYTEEQVYAAQLLTTKDLHGMNNAQIAAECKISDRTLYRWLASEGFLELLNYFADLSQDAFVPELYSQLRKAVRAGSTRAMELVLKNRGKLIDRKEVSGSLEVSAKPIEGMDKNAIMLEIEELKRKIDGQRHVLPQLPEPKDDES